MNPAVEIDLFGAPLVAQAKDNCGGYAARPGSGPAGETCQSCEHCHGLEIRSGRRFYKCKVIKHRWTSGLGTDIRLSSPACSFWKPEPDSLPEISPARTPLKVKPQPLPVSVNIKEFSETGYFHCKRCFHAWQPCTEDDGYSDAAENPFRYCPKCASRQVKWNPPLPK